MDAQPKDSDLLLRAVELGALTTPQVEECLRERERQQASSGGAAVKPIHTVAMEMGYLTERRILEIAAEQKMNRESSSVSIQIGMSCLACNLDYPIPLQDALARPKCAKCGAFLTVRAPVSSGPKSFAVPQPPDVTAASANPKNRFGKYVLVSKLGSGGMGDVFKAWDTVLGRWIALKVPRSMGDEEIRRLYLEAQGAGRLNHPNIASVYEIGEVDGRHYIAMQFIEGMTVEQALTAGPKPDTREIVRWIRDAALGAHYAHERGVVHRDFKPQNLMVDTDGRVYVMDFGLAKLNSTQGSGTITGAILGTPSFMSPEQASGKPSEIDRQSDVYSLGSTLYVLLSGHKPFDGETVTEVLVRILTAEPPALHQVAPTVPSELDVIVDKAMRRSKRERYATAKELADELTRFLTGEPVQARPQTITRRVVRKAAHHRHLLAGIAAVLVALAVGIVLARPGRVEPPAPAPDRLAEWSTLFATIRATTSPDSFDAGRAAPLLAAARKDFPGQKGALDDFLDGHRREIAASLSALPRSRWRDPAQRSRVDRYRAWLAFAGAPTADADRILAFRGTVTLEVLVRPPAELRGPLVGPFSPEQRLTPTTLREVEILDGDLELTRPSHGTCTVKVRNLQDGKTYVIEGDWMNGDILEAREIP